MKEKIHKNDKNYQKNNWHINNDNDLFAKRFYEEIEAIHLQLKEDLKNQRNNDFNINDLSISIINKVLFVFISLKHSVDWTLPQINKLQNKITLPEFIQFLTSDSNIHENELLKRFTSNQNEIVYKLLLDSKLLIKLIRILNSYNYDFCQKNANIINSQIICNLYEYLANKSVDTQQKSKSGIFYTQTEEIELMCKLALADNLINKSDKKHQDIIYDLIFSDNKEYALLAVKKQKMASKLLNQLETITIIDPSCGSGLFLIEMLSLLTNLIELLSNKTRNDIIHNIITNSLYGIDVKEWAYEACTYHLWILYLQTVNLDDKHKVKNLSFQTNITCSDSLLNNWSNLFPEIYSNKDGFDIVISNPPYIRHENITKPVINNSNEEKRKNKEYKNLLIDKITTLYPELFTAIKDQNQIKFDAKSDLYVYFYYISLFNLNEKGSLCFITSNSWLDVEFGNSLKHLIIDKYNLKLLIDNNNNRSFKSADINTVISLISNTTNNKIEEKESLFLTINTKFKEVNFQKAFQEIHQSKSYNKNKTYSILPIKQSELRPNNNASKPKWGSHYLRAPEIYRIIKNRMHSKLVPLSNVCKVSFGIKSGANKFFYLSNKDIKQWNIEPEFLKPFLYSFKEIDKLQVEEYKLHKSLFVCNSSKQELFDHGYTNALKYIDWGESQNYHLRPSIKNRNQWYTLPKQGDIHFVSNRFLGERFGFPTIENIPVCDVFCRRIQRN